MPWYPAASSTPLTTLSYPGTLRCRICIFFLSALCSVGWSTS